MNYTTAKCGRPIVAIGAPGSQARVESESLPCTGCLNERAMFEEWAKARRSRLCLSRSVAGGTIGKYIFHETQSAWMAWCAAKGIEVIG